MKTNSICVILKLLCWSLFYKKRLKAEKYYIGGLNRVCVNTVQFIVMRLWEILQVFIQNIPLRIWL